MRSGAGIVAVVAAGVAACSLIYGPSDAEFSSGKPDAGQLLPDGAPATTATSSSTSSSGAVTPGDSGADANAAFVCPAAAAACTDFEDPDAVAFPSTTGDVAIVSPGDDSGHALAATLHKKQDPPQVSASFTPASALATLDFWFKLDSDIPDKTDHFRLASVLWGAGCDWQLSTTAYLQADGLVFDLSSYDMRVNDSCGPVKFTSINPSIPSSAVVDGNWHHIVIATDAHTKHITVTSTLDQRTPYTQSFDLDRDDIATTVNVALGVPCVQQSGGCFGWDGPDWRVLFDDISLTLPKP